MTRSADLARDQETRTRAQTEFDRPQVVEAGAGTGKTAVLVARVLAWCLGEGWERTARRLSADGDAPTAAQTAREVLGRVVAITFTEAAAAEMSTRISEGLLLVRRGQRPVGLLAEAIPDEAAERAQALLDASDQIVIQTIHAFCRRLLAAYPMAARLHPAFEVDADEAGLTAVAREVLESHLQRAYGADADDDALALGLAGIGPPALEDALAGLLRAGATPADLGDPVAPLRIAAWKRAFLEALAAFEEAERGDIRCAGRKQESTVERLSATKRALAAMPATSEALQAFFAEAQASFEKTDRSGRLAKWARGDFTAKTQVVGREAEVASAVKALLPFVDGLLETDLDVLVRGHRVLGRLLEDAREQMRRRGWEPFAGLLRDAETLLERSPEVAAQVRAGIDQILVDEFQDTDAGQCEILRRLLHGEGPTVFVVGDPKQSIYGWRNADLAAYRAFTEELVPEPSERGLLCVNHRSVQPVLDEVERCIAPLFGTGSRWQAPFQPLHASEERRQDPGFRAGDAAPVEHWVSWQWADGAPVRTTAAQATRLEADAVAADIAGHLARGDARPGDFGILLRNLGDLEVVLSALRNAGVPYMVERDQGYYQRREIIDAAALVRWLLDPNDTVALVAVLKGPLVGVPDAALVPLWEAGLPATAAAIGASGDAATAAAWAALRGVAVPEGIPGIDRIEGWRENACAFFASVGALRTSWETEAPDRFVEQLRRTLLVEAAEASRVLGQFRLANLDRFFRDLAARLEADDARAVLAALRTSTGAAREEEEGRPRDVDDRAVHVLSIHKAKGLAFEQVYLMQMHRGHGGSDRFRTSLERRGARSALTLLGAPTLEVPLLALDRMASEQAERERVLYVAMTRARRRLVLVGNPDTRSQQAPVRLLDSRIDRPPDLDAVARDLGDADGTPSWVDLGGARWRFPGRRPVDAIRPPPGAAAEARAHRLERAAEGARVIAARQERASARMSRPFAARASDVHAGWADREQADASERDAAREVAGADTGAADGARARARAMLAGTAVHAALEVHSSRGDEGDERALAALAAVADGAEPGDHEAVHRIALASWQRFRTGPLYPRWSALADRIVARELPVALASPAAQVGGPVAYRTGAIDLVYRDLDGRWVVVDYKTDAVEGEAEIAERARQYATQGAAYTDALARALGLEACPRFELWFLHPGRVVEPAAPGAPPA